MKKWIQTGCLLIFAGILVFAGNTFEINAKEEQQDMPVADMPAVDMPVEDRPVIAGEGDFSVGGLEAAIRVEPLMQTESEPAPEPADEEEENEYANLAIAHVNDYVNVRALPGTDAEILGRLYNGSVAQVLETAGDDSDWFHVISGSVEGYIKAEYFYYGEEALERIDEYLIRYARSFANHLNVRKEPDTGAGRLGYLNDGERVTFKEDLGDWLQVEYGTKTGYVSADYVTVEEEFIYAKSMEEIRAEEALRREQANREKEKETTQTLTVVTLPELTYGSNEELRSNILEYAKQFLGNKYVHGGNNLASGTDCSGFTSLIYKEFGYSIGRTPGGQLSSAGIAISEDQIQVGDIICYGKSGKCTHVAMYAGDGQIIHSANSKKGVIMGDMHYNTILGIKNVIDA